VTFGTDTQQRKPAREFQAMTLRPIARTLAGQAPANRRILIIDDNAPIHLDFRK